LICQEKVEAVHGLIRLRQPGGRAVAEEEQALLVMWDGTTQDGVNGDDVESTATFSARPTTNAKAVMDRCWRSSISQGKFQAKVAGINPDYSYVATIGKLQANPGALRRRRGVRRRTMAVSRDDGS